MSIPFTERGSFPTMPTSRPVSLKLTIIIGSTRPGRVGPTVAHWVDQFARDHGKFQVELVDLADVALPLLDESAHPRLQQYEHEHTRRWSALVASSDAFVFVTPEYDYFPPATLVNAIQFLMKEWAEKPAAIVSYGGISGGLRSTQQLRLLISNVNMMPLQASVPIPMVTQFIGEDKVFRPNEPMSKGTKAMFDELHRWAVALKAMRERPAE